MAESKTRKLHYDLLRILAAFSVVVLHVSAQAWYDRDLHSAEWMITNAYDAVVRFGVPVFVMISGAMFLDPEYHLDVKRLYGHNILRMVVLYAVWCVIYGVYNCWGFDFAVIGIKPLLRAIIGGHYHLWFIPMIVGIYLLLPVLKGWVEKADKRQIEYFLGLFFVLQIVRITLRALVVSDEIQAILDLGEIEMACGYIGYFVWGYYVAHVGLGKRLQKAVYLLFVPSMVLNIVISTLLSWRAGVTEGTFFDSYGIFTFLISTALLAFAVDKGSQMPFGGKSSGVIRELSANTLGVYLLHVGLLEIGQRFGICSTMIPVWLGVPVLSICCFLVCTIIAGLLRRIPLVGKYLC